MKIGKMALVAATLGIALAGPAYAAKMWWSKFTFTTATQTECVAYAAAAAKQNKLENIEVQADYVIADLPDAIITLFCFPAPDGTTALVTVATGEDWTTEQTIALRDRVRDSFSAGPGQGLPTNTMPRH